MTQSLSEETIDKEKYEGSSYQEVLEKADELQDDYYNKRVSDRCSDTMPDLSKGSWLTGLTEGEIINIDVNENDNLILTIRRRNGEISEVLVRDKNTEYTDNNELARLLKFKNIPEGRIEELLGRTVPLYVDRYALPSNDWAETKWKIYTPQKFGLSGKIKYKLDQYMRYMGYEGEFQSKLIAFAFLTISLFWWVLLLTVISTGYIATQAGPSSYTATFAIITMLSFLLTVYTPMITRGMRIANEKYKEMRHKETIFK